MNRGNDYSDAGDGDHTRATETIRAEIDRTRAEMDRTVDALQDKLDPQVLIHRTFDSIRENAGDVTSKVLDVIKRNPIPAALIVIGLVWLIAKPASSDGASKRTPKSRGNLHSQFGSRFGRSEMASEISSEFNNPIRGSVSSMSSSRISMGREEDQSGCGGL
jgi:hypothetical protein